MIITFNNPPTNCHNPLVNFNPTNKHHYPVGAGVYVYGLRLIVDGKLQFVPLYVGIAKDLKKRIRQHYNEEKTDGNSKWYVFNYSKIASNSDVSNLYHDMEKADTYRGLNNNRFTNSLIWFNNPAFFDWKLSLATGTSTYKPHSGVLSSIKDIVGDLDGIGSSQAIQLKNQIVDAKRCFDKDFYYIYATLDNDLVCNNGTDESLKSLYKSYKLTGAWKNGDKNGPGKFLAEALETETKYLFRKLNICTVAKSHKNRKFAGVSLNLNAVQNNLILVENPYITGGTYKNPLFVS